MSITPLFLNSFKAKFFYLSILFFVFSGYMLGQDIKPSEKTRLEIVQLSAAKSEILPGESVRMKVEVKNNSNFISSNSTFYFHINFENEYVAQITGVDLGKKLPTLNPGQSIEFDYLVTFPKDFQHPFAYIIGYIVESDRKIQEDWIQKFIAIKTANKLQYKGGMYAQDLKILGFLLSENKIKRGRFMNFELIFTSISNAQQSERPLLEFYLSKDKKWDESDIVFKTMLIPNAPYNQEKIYNGKIKIDEIYQRGKWYIFSKLSSETLFDNDLSNNYSPPALIKIK